MAQRTASHRSHINEGWWYFYALRRTERSQTIRPVRRLSDRRLKRRTSTSLSTPTAAKRPRSGNGYGENRVDRPPHDSIRSIEVSQERR